jgi:hypothetical protein
MAEKEMLDRLRDARSLKGWACPQRWRELTGTYTTWAGTE